MFLSVPERLFLLSGLLHGFHSALLTLAAVHGFYFILWPVSTPVLFFLFQGITGCRIGHTHCSANWSDGCFLFSQNSSLFSLRQLSGLHDKFSLQATRAIYLNRAHLGNVKHLFQYFRSLGQRSGSNTSCRVLSCLRRLDVKNRKLKKGTFWWRESETALPSNSQLLWSISLRLDRIRREMTSSGTSWPWSIHDFIRRPRSVQNTQTLNKL